MGYYIQTDSNRDKAEYLVRNHAGLKLLRPPRTFAEIPADKALITVVDNFAFEAAGLCYDEGEFRDFTSPRDQRPRQYVLLDKDLAYKLAGYAPRESQSQEAKS